MPKTQRHRRTRNTWRTPSGNSWKSPGLATTDPQRELITQLSTELGIQVRIPESRHNSQKRIEGLRRRVQRRAQRRPVAAAKAE